MRKVDFKIYPTLVDSYYYFLSSEYMTEQEMIDRINRVELPPSEAMAKGSAMNNLIDSLLAGAIVTTGVKKKRSGETFEVYKTAHEGFTFEFDRRVVDEILRVVKGSTTQVFSEAVLETMYGDVLLYGYCDFLWRNVMRDLKTTSRYTFPKYGTGFQHKCYLFTMRENGNDVDTFDYVITDTRNVYLETYHWNEGMVNQMLNQLNGLLEFIIQNQHLIKNDKLFGK